MVVKPPNELGARIGPNSVLQLVPVLDEHIGVAARERLLANCGLAQLPSDEGLMEEGPAAELHQAVRREHPTLAPDLTRQAGDRTGQYIIDNRIPVAALKVLRALPPWLAAPLLASVIEKHAWTFAGSGKFRVRSRHPLIFELKDNPVVRGERADAPICHWHVAVFERLFRHIVDDRLRCVETHCCASGSDSCRFELR
jgi:divinyl protochlorophyllide a 8-vinyl-reductase